MSAPTAAGGDEPVDHGFEASLTLAQFVMNFPKGVPVEVDPSA